MPLLLAAVLLPALAVWATVRARRADEIHDIVTEPARGPLSGQDGAL